VVGLDSVSYIRRAEDAAMAMLILRPGVTVLVIGAPSSRQDFLTCTRGGLGARIQPAYSLGDFQLIDESHFKSLRGLLFYFAHRISKELRTPIKPNDVWDDALGAMKSLTDFLERGVLEHTQSAFSMAADEVDRVFQYKVRKAFFGMIRAWHKRGRQTRFGNAST